MLKKVEKKDVHAKRHDKKKKKNMHAKEHEEKKRKRQKEIKIAHTFK